MPIPALRLPALRLPALRLLALRLPALRLLAVACALGACGGRPPPHGDQGARLRALAGRELGCPEDALRPRRIPPRDLHVDGCGAWIRLSCRRDGATCVVVDRGRSARRTTWSDREVERTRARIAPQLAVCLPPGREGTEVEVELGADGRLRRRGTRDESADCVERVLAAARLPGVADEGRDVTWFIAADTTEADDEIVEEARAEELLHVTPGERARRVVDRIAPYLLRCAGGAAISLQLSWTRDGRIDALVSGATTPEVERCVRSQVQRVRIASPGGAGTIQHTVSP